MNDGDLRPDPAGPPASSGSPRVPDAAPDSAGTPGPALPDSPGSPASPAEPRPWLERIGLAAIAFVMAALLTVMAIAAWIGGEWILAAMSGSGALLTLGVGLLTLIRG